MECCKYKGHDCDGCRCCDEEDDVLHYHLMNDPECSLPIGSIKPAPSIGPNPDDEDLPF